jgi:hypothetical protein
MCEATSVDEHPIRKVLQASARGSSLGRRVVVGALELRSNLPLAVHLPPRSQHRPLNLDPRLSSFRTHELLKVLYS